MKKINALFFLYILFFSNCIKINKSKNNSSIKIGKFPDAQKNIYKQKLITLLSYGKFLLNDEIKTQLEDIYFYQAPKISDRFVSELIDALNLKKDFKIPMINNLDKDKLIEYLNFADGLLSNLENKNKDLYNLLIETSEKITSSLILNVEQLYLPSINKIFNIINMKEKIKDLSNYLNKMNINDIIDIINQTEKQIKNKEIDINLIQLNSNNQFKNFVPVNGLITSIFSIITITSFISVIEKNDK
jgi:hypothetical protein